MSNQDEKKTAITDLVVAGLAIASPAAGGIAALAVSLKRLIWRLGGGPDTGQVFEEALRADIEYFAGRLEAASDNIARRATLEEVVEVTAQVFSNITRTASSEKRRALAEVCVNGLASDASAVEKRYLLRAINELDLDHVAILRTGLDPRYRDFLVAPAGALGLGLLAELRQRHLTERRYDRISDGNQGAPPEVLYGTPLDRSEPGDPPLPAGATVGSTLRSVDEERLVQLSTLGRRFLEFLGDDVA
jgi:hypothetical protein